MPATCPPDNCLPPKKAPTPAPCKPTSFDAGNYQINYDGRCISKIKRSNAVPDGIYERVQIQDGMIVAAWESSGEQVVIENPCAAPGGGPGGSVTVSPDNCNLTSIDGAGALLTRLAYTFGPYLEVGGCGSNTAPLVLNLDFQSVRADVLAGGINYSGCGYEIVDGVVNSWVPPVTTITSNNPALQVTRNGCDITLNVIAQSGSIAYSRPWCRRGSSDQLLLRGMGFVFRGAGNSANVSVFATTEADAAGAPTPPASFTSVQDAVNWLDSNLPPC